MSLAKTRNSVRADRQRLVGSGIMICFASVAFYRWQQTHILFFMLLAFRDLVAAYYLAIRRATEGPVQNRDRVLAYISSILPLLYLPGVQTNRYLILSAIILNIVGFLISTLATIELGDRMGVAPAKRGEICNSGVYKLNKHPMYTGYILAEIGNVILNPINLVILLFSVLGYAVRAKRENAALKYSKSLCR